MCFYFILIAFSFKTWSSLSKLEKLHFLVIFFLGSNELVNCLRRVKVGCFLPVLFYLTDPSTSSFNWWSRSCFCLVQMNTTGIEVLRPLPCHEKLPKKGLEYRIGSGQNPIWANPKSWIFSWSEHATWNLKIIYKNLTRSDSKNFFGILLLSETRPKCNNENPKPDLTHS